MTKLISVNVPDIGDVSDVDVIELLVAVGDTIKVDDAIVTLETDKATMEVPSSQAGLIKALHVKVGDKINQGDLLLELESLESETQGSETNGSDTKGSEIKESESKSDNDSDDNSAQNESDTTTNQPSSKQIDLLVPDIGDAADVDVIEILISVGDSIEKDQGLITLETDKATMEVPASNAGVITAISIKVGDKVSQGHVLGQIEIQSESTDTITKSNQRESSGSKTPAAPATQNTSPMPATASKNAPVPDHPQMKKKASGGIVHASPAVRRFARELGADLSQVKGTGLKSRIQKEDVQNFIKFELSRPKATAATGAFNTPQMPAVDHAKWGEIEEKALSRIQKISSVNLHRNWISIPHVTQHEDADITELDQFRKSLKDEALKDGVRLTPLAFIMKGLVHTLKAFPKFNASLGNDGENLVIKHYYHIGVAVETPDGLTVPVIRDVDKKGIYELATELGEISAKARDKKLSANDMQGSSFTISSLGGIGGTAFSPIVKWPDVAILGLSRNKMQPVWNGNEFVPRLMLPMSLSYDHRVIDGADAARFVVHLSKTLNDIRRVLLK